MPLNEQVARHLIEFADVHECSWTDRDWERLRLVSKLCRTSRALNQLVRSNLNTRLRVARSHLDNENIPTRNIRRWPRLPPFVRRLTFSGDHAQSEPVVMEAAMTAADLSGKHLDCTAAILLATFLPACE